MLFVATVAFSYSSVVLLLREVSVRPNGSCISGSCQILKVKVKVSHSLIAIVRVRVPLYLGHM